MSSEKEYIQNEIKELEKIEQIPEALDEPLDINDVKGAVKIFEEIEKNLSENSEDSQYLMEKKNDIIRHALETNVIKEFLMIVVNSPNQALTLVKLIKTKLKEMQAEDEKDRVEEHESILFNYEFPDIEDKITKRKWKKDDENRKNQMAQLYNQHYELVTQLVKEVLDEYGFLKLATLNRKINSEKYRKINKKNMPMFIIKKHRGEPIKVTDEAGADKAAEPDATAGDTESGGYKKRTKKTKKSKTKKSKSKRKAKRKKTQRNRRR